VSIVSFGLGNSSLGSIREWLIGRRIDFVVDVRSVEMQERNRRFYPSKLSDTLEGAGIHYRDFSKTLGDRPDYRLHMISKDFSDALDDLLELTDLGKLAILCSEKDFKKCHRKLIASQLSRRNVKVQHSVVDLNKRLPSQMTLEEVERELERPERVLFTIGFGKKSMREFGERMRACKIERLVDIRLRPVSKYVGYARQDDLDYLLELLGIGYVHLPDLAPDDELLEKYRKDNDWNYYERRFQEILEERSATELIEKVLSGKRYVCLMCTEDLPLRCHRRLVAEYARSVFPGLEILHITSSGIEKHQRPLEGYSGT
jgi:uncharacterized protein (DUF488 family)